MKAIIVHDPDFDVRLEGKFISVKMGKTKQENRSEMINEAKQHLMQCKADLGEYRNEANSLLKSLEPILDQEDIINYRKQMEDVYKKYIGNADDIHSKKIADINKAKRK